VSAGSEAERGTGGERDELAAATRVPRPRATGGPPETESAALTGSVHPLLEARDLHVGFGGKGRAEPPIRAVDGVELSIDRGQIMALAGESGCGKTTLARTLLGLERPWRGEVRHDGRALSYSGRGLKAYRRRVQLVLQDPTGALNPRRTVYEAVAEGLRIHRVPGDEREQVARALALAGLRPAERFFARYPHELSGGQRQRVVIAGALVLNPDMIIADEPVSSLDASVRGEILALLLSLRDKLGLSVLVVTHDLGLAWNIADRLAVMYLGRIVESGRTEQVLSAPRHPYTAALLSVLPEAVDRAPIILQGETPDSSRIPSGCRFHPRCPALADGTAERANVSGRCVTEMLPVLPAAAGHRAACLLATHVGDGIAGAAGGRPIGVIPNP
jgi:peptide/nickel transport system ATP-binding protein